VILTPFIRDFPAYLQKNQCRELVRKIIFMPIGTSATIRIRIKIMAKKRKVILITAIVLFAGVAIAVPVAIKHYSEPNFADMSPRQVRQYFDSNEFRDANEEQRRLIREKMGEAMQARMEKEANGYFALPEGEQRTAYLDNIIDEMQARRAEFMANRDPNRFDPNRPFDPNRIRDPNRPFDPNRFGRFGQRNGAAGQRPRPNPSQMRERSERTTADSRVKNMQFRQAMADRMAQRGIQMGPGGRGGFGGGPGGFGGPGGPGGGPPRN
jgi:hypothetical protein